jgi:hypothetical protein
MKQTEKLDLILKKLYECKFDGKNHSIQEILKAAGIIVNRDEVYELGKYLDSRGLIEMTSTKESITAEITSDGVEYCEEDSFSLSGHSIVTNNYNIKIANSPGANIVNLSSNVTITNQITEISNILEKFKKTIDEDVTVSEGTKNDIKECLLEIDNNLKAGQVPKFGIRKLIELAGDISSIASFVISLIQLINK